MNADWSEMKGKRLESDIVNDSRRLLMSTLAIFHITRGVVSIYSRFLSTSKAN